MQKNFEKTDSYQRENPEKEATMNMMAANNHVLDNAAVGNVAEKGMTGNSGKGYFPTEHASDVNSRTIFRNRELTCQFLRDYSDLSIFADLRPEDIEDVTDRYKAFLGVEFETDTIKRCGCVSRKTRKGGSAKRMSS